MIYKCQLQVLQIQQMQNLMEKSGLVIIDFEKAIQYGYVRVCEEIHKQYLEEYEQ